MNNLYNWHDERLAQLKNQDLDRELEQIRLLREAGLADHGWLARLGRKVNGGMLAFVRRLRVPGNIKQASYKSTQKKTV
jgi:hypothetical protein